VKLTNFGGALFFLLDERVGLSKGGLYMVEAGIFDQHTWMISMLINHVMPLLLIL
jgi:hypothetical protein